jgi:hypothetical protein
VHKNMLKDRDRWRASTEDEDLNLSWRKRSGSRMSSPSDELTLIRALVYTLPYVSSIRASSACDIP